MNKDEQLLFKQNSFLEKELAAKNRELEIEASLEQVREKATAMRASEELNVLIATVFVELTKLDLVLTRCVIMIYDTSLNGFHWWMANSETPSVPMNFFVKDTNLPFFNAYLKGWQERTMKWTFELEGENKIRVDDFLFTKTELSLLPDFVISGMRAPEKVFLNASFNNFGNLTLASLEPLTDEQFQIMLRFAKVFDLTYTRFNDLQKAEAQAMEAEIELALERVRAVAMGMKQPSDMLEVCKIISEQLSGLSVKEIRNVQTAIIYEARHSYMNYEYYAKHDKTFITEVDFTDHSVKSAFANQMSKGKGYFFSTTLEGEKLKEFIEHQKEGREFVDPFLFTSPSVTWYWYSLGAVALGISTYAPLNENEVELFKRFRNVFELAYRRYLDIENAEAQAREAQIQLALERVRARTMAMQKSDELSETVFALFQQFKELGENPDQATIGVMNEEEKVIEYWVTMYGQPINKVFKFPIDEPNVTNKIYKAWKENKKSLVINLSGKALTEFMAYRAGKGGAAVNPDEKRRTINVAFFSKGLLNVQFNEERSEESIKLLERFASVFEQTYTRFLDLKKAEAQTRESKIEASLERMRSRTMGMQRSHEIVEVASLLHKELLYLGIKQFATCGYVEVEEENKRQRSWLTSPDGTSLEPFYLPLTGEPVFDERYKAWKRKDTVFRQIVYAEDLKRHLNHAYTGFGSKESEDVGRNHFPDPTIFYNCNFSHGYLSLVTGILLSEEEELLMGRFTRVFEQSYSRFLDLKKAEAQTRENQIQLALERVRARTMAMQKSDELKETTLVLFQQFQQLQQTPNQVSICIFDDQFKTGEMYVTLNGQKIDRSFKMELDEEVFVMKKAKKAFIEKQKNFSATLTGKELQKYNRWRNSFVGQKRWDESDLALKESWHVQAAFFSKGMIGISSDSSVADETVNLLERFARVFDATYTRFNDLQKAEAQARAAQIEAALERVRSKTMGMHKSSDLLDLIRLLGDQFQLLGFKIHSANFNTSYRQKDWNLWLYNPGNPVYPKQVHVPYFDHPFFNRTLESIASGSNFHTVVFTKEEKNGFLDHLYAHTIARNSSEERKKFTYDAPGFAWSTVYLKNTALTIANYDAEPYTGEQNEIIRRFGSSFEQAYTRFLDLQKAEAQAREAQIQLALERVRAKTMAMQKPSEFVDVINIIGEQFLDLGFDFDWVNFSANGLDVSKAIDIYNFHVIPGLYQGATRVVIPFFEHPVFKKAEESVNEYRTSGNSFTVVLLGKKDKDTWLDHLFTNTIYKDLPDEAKTSQYNREVFQSSNVVLKDTWLSVGKYDPKPLTDEQVAILKRLANEFGQAYTRFLDLQKAEAQAREAQIEAGLERVRSRAMAMQSSEELAPLIGTVFTELIKLDLALTRCVIWIFDPETNGATWWMANSEDAQHPISCDVPFNAFEPHLVFLEQWKKRANKFQYELSGTIKKNWDDYLFNNTGLSRLPAIVIDGMKAPERVFLTASFNNFGALNAATLAPLSEQDLDISLRFAKVFDLTYTRFNDLKQAEAQAREAEIQLALERVRARTMAMQQSNELSETTAILFAHFNELGNTAERLNIGIIKEDEGFVETWATEQGGNQINHSFSARLDEPTTIAKLYEGWKTKKTSMVVDLSGKELKQWIGYLQHELKMPVKEELLQNRRVQTVAYFKEGFILITSPEPFAAETISLLERFAEVFNLTYTRFLDLKKAEAQAREAQIEASLERVRSKTMAMHNSNDVNTATAVMFNELSKLGVENMRCGIGILHEDSDTMEVWGASITADGHEMKGMGQVGINAHKLWQEMYRNWRLKNENFLYHVQGEDKKAYYRVLIGEQRYNASYLTEDHPDHYCYITYFSDGAIFAFNPTLYNEEQKQILKRFAAVFSHTYRRYQDLKKAEAQAREAQIEAALERVRAQSMAMGKSEDLALVVSSVFNELEKLEVKALRCGIGIINGSTRSNKAWITTSTNMGKTIELSGDEPLSGHTLLDTIFINWKAQKSFSYILEGNDLINYYKAVGSTNFQGQFAKEVLSNSNVRHYYHCVMFPAGGLFTFSETPFSNETYRILKRFGDAFYHAYKRFKDLQLAEAQAKEAKIEAALEKVRSRSLAMHKSEEIQEVINEVFIRLQELQINLDSANILIFQNGSKDFVCWTGSIAKNSTSSLFGYKEIPFLTDMVKANKDQIELFTRRYSLEQKNNFFNYAYENTGLKETPDDRKQFILGAPCHTVSVAFSKNIAINLNSYSRDFFTEEENNIVIRFAKVFEQSYTRFLDLEKAEAQAREAQIEASLERVRGKAMAMHNSQDLSDTIGVFYHELKSFSLTPIRCGVGLLDREERIGEMFTWNTTEQGDSLELVGRLKMEGHAVSNKVYESWLTQTEYHPVLRGDEIKEYNKLLKPQLAFPDYKNDVQFGYFFFFPEGGVYAWTEKEMQQDELQIYRRFTSVLSLTYKRYRDLQKAEASAKEAVKQSALDRIRADIASMRTVSDLDRITPLIWNELTILGVPFIRCGVFIMDDQEQQIHTFLSTPEGKGIAAFHLRYNTPGNIRYVISHWQKKEIYTDHWDEEAFKEFADNLVKQGAMKSSKQYLSTMPAGGFNLHFVPFHQGMLYVGNIAPLGKEEIDLLQSLADAFSTAYARYEDFNKLEAAKKHIEKTLTELKQAQQQLVQSEKMASLGELTAGIAHEIQNPLNFVNNFSDVNTELIEEMKTELNDGNVQDAIAIANDIQENEQKINHHGKRADAIVKGMLQHSRKSSGQKEPTDINALADEYLRLSYHGLRAKDKNFNATIETDFDKSVEKINVIPQDIGRVLLNLFNNAFYAVNEQKRSNLISYQPTVFVRTQECDGKIQIAVRDNGNGIPQKIVDKIFQPFFTTKPTGQGTGLGLSLSYDIIKAHGGEIKVESKEGEGSVFIIQLPFA